MKEALLEWIGTVVAIKTIQGDSFEGQLKKVTNLAYVDVSGKGLFCCSLDHITLAVRVAQVSIATKTIERKMN